MDHLATGDIDVTYGNLPEGTDASVDKTVELMQEMAKGKFGARSPKIRAAAINIINGLDPITGDRIGASVANKDYFGMLEAIHNYVRDNIRYVKDVVGQETLSYPEETLFNSQGGDCDDMTILEIALLGSIGLRAYPVVIGLEPNHFSHVYLYAEIPPGRHRGAGKTFAADPIMREWALGTEAPAHRVKNKRTYPQLAGLGTMNGIHGYADGPSYLSPLDEQEAVQVPRVLKSRYVDTGSRGEIITTKRLLEHGDELDSMFDRANTTQFPMQAAPAFELYNRGPVTNRAEKVMTSYLHERSPVRKISAPFGTPIGRGPKIVIVGERPRPARKGTKAPTVGELMGLADYLADMTGPALKASRRSLVNGKSDILHRTAAIAAYTKQRAKKASGRVVNWSRNSGFLFGLGSLEAEQQLNAAKQIEKLAHDIAARAQHLAEACAGGSPARLDVLNQDIGTLEHLDCHLGVLAALAEAEPSAHPRIDAQEKIDALVVIGQNPSFREASIAKATPDAPRRPRNPIAGVLPGGAVVRDQNGDVIYADDGSDDGLAGFFSKVKKKLKATTQKIVNAPKKAVESVHKQVKNVGKTAEAALKNKRLREIAMGVATGGASLLTRKTIHEPLQKMLAKDKAKTKSPQQTTPTVYTDANGNVITKDQYDALMAQYNQQTMQAPATEAPEYPGSAQSFDYGGDSVTDPSYGGSSVMDPYAMPSDSFGPEEMGPAVESESPFMSAGPAESMTTTMDVSESGIEPFADEEGASFDEGGGDFAAEDAEMSSGEGDDESEGAYADEGVVDDDATEGAESSFSEENAPHRRKKHHKRRGRGRGRWRGRASDEGPIDLDNESVDEADDMDADESQDDSGDEPGSAEGPAIDGLPSAGGGLGVLALIGLGLYLATRR